jgi:hypothetical protein
VLSEFRNTPWLILRGGRETLAKRIREMGYVYITQLVDDNSFLHLMVDMR